MNRATADQLVVTEHADEWPENPVQGEPALSLVGELTQKAAWHIASLARVIRQLEQTTEATRPRGTFDVAVESQLTRREQQVLGLLVQGMSNRKIAWTLRISESTVKNHLHAIFLKLDVTDRAQAIAAVLGGRISS
jgi:DNA-binding NarL/FixJ family response regulator